MIFHYFSRFLLRKILRNYEILFCQKIDKKFYRRMFKFMVEARMCGCNMCLFDRKKFLSFVITIIFRNFVKNI